MKRIAVLASGRGSNFQAILDARARGEINGECVALITDNKDAYAIERAKAAGVPRSARSAAGSGVRGQDYRIHRTLCGRKAGLRTIILQKAVPVLDDDEEVLDERILVQEPIAFPEAAALFCADRLVVSGRHVKILSETP